MSSIKKIEFSNWSKWDNRIKNLENLSYPGIYALRVSRFRIEGLPFDWDKSIVYFGMTNSKAGLRGRLEQFNNTLRDKSGGGHGGADRFRFDYEEGDKLAQRLYVATMPFKCDVKNMSAEGLIVQGKVAMAEYLALAEYFNLYGELPKYNNRSFLAPKRSRGRSEL